MDDTMVVKDGPKRLTVEEWNRHLDAQAVSGLRVTDYCDQNNISKHQYYYWRGKLRGPSPAHTGDAFVECRIGRESGAEGNLLMLECPGGYRLHIGNGCGMGMVEGMLEVLKKCSAC